MIPQEGILPVNKQKGFTSFYLVRLLRKITGVRKIGHAGTLDPFATGVMVLLIGRSYTKVANTFIDQDKEYITTIRLGVSTSTYDCDGQVTATSPLIPSRENIEGVVVERFQGTYFQIPPMYSAKKIKGQRLYVLARQGIELERKPVCVHLKVSILDYHYPKLMLKINCSKGTYVRTIAHDLGQALRSEAHVADLVRTRSGPFQLKDCIDSKRLLEQI